MANIIPVIYENILLPFHLHKCMQSKSANWPYCPWKYAITDVYIHKSGFDFIERKIMVLKLLNKYQVMPEGNTGHF